MRKILLFILLASSALGLPHLYFSDIVAGPATGNGDGVVANHGAIVTIWGVALSSSQGTSKVYFKDSAGVVREAAHIYYRKDADGALPGGPADLYTYHKMQEIAFSINSSAALGKGHIYVEVDGKASNSIRFTVNNGEIFFVRSTGSDTAGTGSWANPWKTIGFGTGGATTKAVVGAGDLIYGLDVTENQMVTIRSKDGEYENQIGVIAYPGGYIRVRNTGSNPNAPSGIVVYNIPDLPEYWTISKCDVQASSAGITTFRGGRIIGNAITDYPDGTGCAEGASGAIAGKGNGIMVFGNYIHDWGCYATSNQEHTTYFSNRWLGYDVMPMEFAWNYMIDNQARFGIHFYDENDCWGYKGTVKVHDNVIKNQVGPGFNYGTLACSEGKYLDGDFEVYNNLFIETGQKGANNAGISAIHLYGRFDTGLIKIYNNVIYGYGYAGASSINDGGILSEPRGNISNYNYNGRWEFVNNIVVDTHNLPFFRAGGNPPEVAKNNIWYNGGDTSPSALPSWDPTSYFGNPDFEDPAEGDFHLKAGSHGIDSGLDVRSMVNSDFMGLSRPQGSAVDLGIFENAAACTGTRSCPLQEGVCTGSREGCDGVWEGCDADNYGVSFDGATELRCFDTLDNDCDGLADMSDPDCQLAPLAVYNVRNTTTESSATITWTTETTTSGWIYYDTNPTWFRYVIYDINGTSHRITLSGLAAGTDYYYRVKSCDHYGNCNIPSSFSFKTRLGEFIGCGNGIIESPEICDGDCHPADTGGCDGIDINELLAFINRWKQGSVTISDLLKAIRLWKGA